VLKVVIFNNIYDGYTYFNKCHFFLFIQMANQIGFMNINEVDILLVEDNLDDASLTIRAFRKNHLANKLYHVKDGVEAIDFIFGMGTYAGRNPQEKPKVILLDLNMPKINGIEVLKKLKSDDRLKSIPVVVLTSSKEDPDIEKCYALGANSYIVKPVDFESFQKTIADLGMYWLVLNQSKY
jgi:two-component system response regulator